MRELHADRPAHPRARLAWTRTDGDRVEGDSRKTLATGGGLTETLGPFYRLPVEQREVLVLVAIERLAYEEIATLLGVPVATVMARLISAWDSMQSMAGESMSRETLAK